MKNKPLYDFCILVCTFLVYLKVVRYSKKKMSEGGEIFLIWIFVMAFTFVIALCDQACRNEGKQFMDKIIENFSLNFNYFLNFIIDHKGVVHK